MNAPNINIKDVLKKLSFLKNNMALLVPIVGWVWPKSGLARPIRLVQTTTFLLL